VHFPMGYDERYSNSRGPQQAGIAKEDQTSTTVLDEVVVESRIGSIGYACDR